MNLKNISHKSESGFTLIELIVATTIVMVLTAVTVVNLRTGSSEQALLRSAQTLAFNIRKAQNLALAPQPNAGKTVCVYGIKAAANSGVYVLYFNDDNIGASTCNGVAKKRYAVGGFSPPSPPGVCNSCIAQVYLEKGVTIVDAFDVSFEPPEPMAYWGGFPMGVTQLSITLTNGTQTRSVLVNQFGRVRIQ